ncbi:histone-lysine N-methyltransferase EHMT2-like [Pelmatolapia mariae]|uniref:histone-lysine N-methyltransferase EHMT2-like n=1 Tax=Pelmatolapia mariae TaxID=158779 RepID=UPI002FE668C9
MRRRRIPPREDAVCHVSAGRNKLGLDIHYINAFKGRGIFTTVPFQKGDFLLEYRGKLITKDECERRHRVYHDSLKVFMFEFKFDGKLWCVDASQEDGSLGRLVNDNHISPSAKMKILNINGKPHLCLFASRDISPGEEIDYNYGDSDWPWRCKTETSQIQKTVSCLKPQPNCIPNNDLDLKHPEPERDHDEEMPQQGSEAMHSSSAQDSEETETSQIQKTVSCLKPQPNCIPNNDLDLKHPEPERCHSHRLVCTTISSLDKCIQCVGPVSSLKWLGYKCKGESGVVDVQGGRTIRRQ